MNKEQARHAASMVKHMLDHMHIFRARLLSLRNAWMTDTYYAYSLASVYEIFNEELDRMMEGLEQVRTDMLSELEGKE